jgi:hypothetical protein
MYPMLGNDGVLRSYITAATNAVSDETVKYSYWDQWVIPL